MNIEIIGRHALLFDDDTTAAFVNSETALVEWNSLLIDRYDVRHLLSSPPPSRRRRNPQTSHTSSADAEIDYERYLDLPSPSDQQEEEPEPEPVGGFNAVPFSYTNYEDSNNQKMAETESEIPRFNPPFPVPDNLVQNLPPTEKVHQIIARTALFVSKNGGQSEIVLRVKQGDNPTFGFLMPDHHLHPYFRFLVNHQDLLQSKDGQHPENEEKTSNTALSLLGSVYGTGEDDDAGTEHASSSKLSSLSKDCLPGKTMLPAGENNDNTFILKKNPLSNPLKASSLKKGENLGSASAVFDKLLDKSRASSLPPIPKTEQILVDPSSEMKQLVDKIVEFIIKNGRQFEKVLMEQDRGHGRFPFLIPSNIFHPYYLKVLQKAQELKLTGKSSNSEKEDFRGYNSNKKTSISRGNEKHTVESDDLPLDSERKEKFKMVINKSKMDGSDSPAKTTQPQIEVQVDAAQAAAILQAATRGIKHPDLGFLLTNEQKLKAERLKRAKMFVAQLKSGASSSKAELPPRGVSAEPQVSLAKESPSDFDISDKRVKSENERFLNEEKRAKRKYRARSGVDNDDDEREEKRSHRHHKKKHRSRDRSLEDESEEKYVKRKHHNSSRKKKHENENEHECSRKKHRSRNEDSNNEVDSDSKSSRRNRKESSRRNRKHRSHYSSHDEVDSDSKSSRRDRKHDEESSRRNRKHRSHDSSHDEVDSDSKSSRRSRKHDEESSRRIRKHRSHDSSHDEVDSDSESSRRNQKHRSRKSSRHSKDRHKHKMGPESEKDELQVSGQLEGNGASREPSMDVLSQDRGPSVQPVEPTDVPDDLRAKIRAMLMSTM